MGFYSNFAQMSFARINKKKNSTSANDHAYVKQLLRDLIRIPSFTGKEQEIGEFVSSVMKSIGLAVTTYNSGGGRKNIVGAIKGRTGNKPALMLNGHVDTQAIVNGWTKDPLGGEESGGRIYGVGSSDQKAGVAAMIAAAKSLADSGLELEEGLLVAAVVGHMEGGRGTRTLVKHGVRAKYGVITEPSQMHLYTQGGGIVYLDITTSGRSAFTPSRDTGINAILKMIKIIEGLEKIKFRYKRALHIKRPYVNVGVIKGGVWPSIVPDSCSIRVDIRTVPSQTPEGVKIEVENLVRRLRQNDPEICASVEFNPTIIENPRNPWSVPEKSELVQTVSKCIASVTGAQAHLDGFQGWVDGAVLNLAGIPTIVYGPGDLDQIYAPEEHVRVKDLIDAERVYTLVAKNICKGSQG